MKRRTFLAAASALAAMRPAWATSGLSAGQFTHGVASGDPLIDGVILWTRFVHANEGAIAWEIGEDEAFATIAQRGEAIASPADDYCVKIDVRGLMPGRRYCYRFLSASGPSPTGCTLTAPAEGAQSLSIALFSCANFGFGYFHAYGHAARREDIDLVVHVGDYIYELPRGAYPRNAETVPGRIVEPARMLVGIEDYYRRYASYHSDLDLLELRRLKPIASIWDDHEIADNAWREGAKTHGRRQGPFADRAAAAVKAYFDWMPIRRQNGARLYRSLDWGDLARIVLLDTRLAGRDRQLEYNVGLVGRLTQAGDAGRAALAEFRSRLDAPERTMLGEAQEDWLARALAESKARGQTWQIIAQQIVMGEQIAAPEMTRLLPDDAGFMTRRYFSSGAQLSALGLPWNLDSWGGYPAARARLLAACVREANNAVALGGDSHNCWLNNLAAPGANRLAAAEFAGGSVTSPGFERPLPGGAPGEREALMRAANPHLAWCDLTNRGYGVLRFSRTACIADWLAFADVRSPEAAPPTAHRLACEASAESGPGAWAV